MKHIQPFVLFKSRDARLSSGLTPKQEGFLNRYTEGTWSVNPTTGLVDVKGNFNCEGDYNPFYLKPFSKPYTGNLKSLSGISFGHVSGHFYCGGNQLTSLKGAPQTVGGVFSCGYNQLTSLEGAPQTVGGDFSCAGNQLTSLEGAPQTVGVGFFCESNQLTSLTGAPQTVGWDFDCNSNRLTSLEGAPQTVSGVFRCDEFVLSKGKWNMEGWLKVLNTDHTGTEEAKRWILTLPVFQPEYWNSKIKEQPKETIIQMVDVWDYIPKEKQDKIQIPSNWKDHFENLLDLQRAGIF